MLLPIVSARCVNRKLLADNFISFKLRGGYLSVLHFYYWRFKPGVDREWHLILLLLDLCLNSDLYHISEENQTKRPVTAQWVPSGGGHIHHSLSLTESSCQLLYNLPDMTPASSEYQLQIPRPWERWECKLALWGDWNIVRPFKAHSENSICCWLNRT